MLYNKFSVCPEESENLDQEMGLRRTVITSQAHVRVCGCLQEGGGQAASKSWNKARSETLLLWGFFPNAMVLNHKGDDTSVNLWAVLGKFVLKAEQRSV